jgi:hypothetical protein
LLISFRNTVHNGSLPAPLCQEVGAQSDTQRSHLRRVRCGGALQKCIEDPLSEVLIQGTINTRLAFIEVFLEYTKVYYRPWTRGKRGRAAVRELEFVSLIGRGAPSRKSPTPRAALGVW